MSEIAQLFTEFFRDLDVVPSDVVAGLVLLRHYQKLRMQHYCMLVRTFKTHSISTVNLLTDNVTMSENPDEILQNVTIHHDLYCCLRNNHRTEKQYMAL